MKTLVLIAALVGSAAAVQAASFASLIAPVGTIVDFGDGGNFIKAKIDSVGDDYVCVELQKVDLVPKVVAEVTGKPITGSFIRCYPFSSVQFVNLVEGKPATLLVVDM